MADITQRSFFKSLVLFLLEDVQEDSQESVLDLYTRWSQKNHLVIKDPKTALWTLEYFARTRNFSREALRNAAVIDGFLAPSKTDPGNIN